MNYYSNICLIIDKLTDKEKTWFNQEVKRIDAISDGKDIESTPPNPENYPGFDIYRHYADSKVSIEDSGGNMDIDNITDVVQRFLSANRPNDIIVVEYTHTTDHHIQDGYGGGVIVISANDVKVSDTSMVGSELRKQMEQEQKTAEEEEYAVSVEIIRGYTIGVLAASFEDARFKAETMDLSDIMDQGSNKYNNLNVLD